MIPTKLPPNWVLRESKDYPGRVYYYNKDTHESTWIRPLIFPHLQKSHPDFQWPPLIYISHILIKHVDSSNLTAWKKPITRSKEDARQKVINIITVLKNGTKKFDEIAKTESEDVDSYQKGGELGWVQRGKTGFDGDFESAAFSLGLNKMTDEPVESSFGWHIIYRLG